MALIIQKYGGTSVADGARVKEVAKRVLKYRSEGHDVVVVVSAPAGVTDSLLKRAKDITDLPDKRELDMLLTTGEQISIALLSMAIKDMGGDAISYNAFQVKFGTTADHTKALITNIDTTKIKERLKEGKVVVFAGFQGITIDNEITTLGRGGSDTTAVALGVALNADEVEIYTDVDGVYTADPRIVKNSKKLNEISYQEMLEMAASGAKVLHPRSVEIAAKYGIHIHLRSSFDNSKGTIVKGEEEIMEKAKIVGVSSSKNEGKITILGMPDKPGIAAKVFATLAKAKINTDIIVQSSSTNKELNNISFTVSKTDLPEAIAISEKIKTEIGATSILSDGNVAKVSVIGVGLKSHYETTADIFDTLAENNINIDMISCSEINVSCIISQDDVDKAVIALHDKFIV
ncbi:MAG: aspartate kinase [Leptotrichiaceae bacterium]|jgi:aspartate kinase|nr:aspartate kinase [Leptotrichiaceae bacterium]MBP6168207.1 aspartate kinase [Leptotrichiaceae bacterium]MBP7026709.1 aspartate kinase [Leptotrichiaceae bacterium]MBP8637297.1 aspartate kinase [Leptotrichiaceae bacterium]MBP9539071.1 aspartate kinase [Leptotrichiaceae bacterium]